MRVRQRVFISSPADVQAAREIAAQTVERLAHEYARFFVIEPFLWENEVMLASGHFQDAIEPPSNFDIVALILWSRLGTMLPEKTEVREYRGIDGRTPVTGSEWEFETALAAARSKGSPDILVYRSREAARVDGWDPVHRSGQLEQLAALDRFWSRHFLQDGKFLGAHSEFDSLEQFSNIFEMHVRQLLQKKINAMGRSRGDGADAVWPHSPFRGLEAYEYEHAPIYFGQDEAIGKALLQLTDNARNGSAFLLLLGASGAGKSSLAKAGIVPRLFVPRRVAGAAFVRRVVFRPSDTAQGEDLFAALARRLTRHSNDGQGLPELLGPEQSIEELAGFLRESSSNPSYPFATALSHLAVRLRSEGRMLNRESARLVLVLDQLEELFTIEAISAEQRRRFVDLVAKLALSGHVWVVATMRSDFWHRAGELPELVKLAERGGRLDVLPPTIAQIGQIIRQPAEATGIAFEILQDGEAGDASHAGTSLNEVILNEVAREPGVLPLLSYLLDQLYRTDILEAQGSTLTFRTYQQLHGLKGAIAARAEAILVAQPPEVRLSLRRLLFLLVQTSETEAGGKQITARRAPLSLFPEGSPVRHLLDAFVDPNARLIVAEGSGSAEPTFRVAHEALFREWGLARELVSEIAGELKTRKMIEERYERWKEIVETTHGARGRLARWRPFSEAGLLAEKDLEDARRLVSIRRGDLQRDHVAYVDRSTATARRKRNLAIQALAALVGVLSVLTVTAIVAAIEAQHYSQVTKDTVESDHQQIKVAGRIGRNYMAGITTDPRELATEVFRLEVALAAQLVQVDPNNPDWRYNLAAGNANVGFGLEKQGRFAEALSYYQKSLAITQKLIAEDPKDRSLKVALSFVQNDIVRLNEARARMNPSASAHK